MKFLSLLAKILCLVSIAIADSALGESEVPNAFAYDLNVKESIISVADKKFRKIEYKNKLYYLQLLESEGDASSLQFQCGDVANPPKMENQITLSVQITKRSSLFLSGLKQTCANLAPGKNKVEIDPNIKIGFFLKDQPGDKLKNKMIYVTPLAPGLGFGAQF